MTLKRKDQTKNCNAWAMQATSEKLKYYAIKETYHQSDVAMHQTKVMKYICIFKRALV